MSRSKYPSLGILDALYRLTTGSNLDPSKNGLYESLPHDNRPSKEKYSKIIYQLRHNGYVGDNFDKFILTKKGEKKAIVRNLQQITLSKKSDGLHRLIAFDIPENKRKARDIIRSKLKSFECDKIQKSLYITPYVCEKELLEVCKILKIENYVTVFVLDKSNFLKNLDRKLQRSKNIIKKAI